MKSALCTYRTITSLSRSCPVPKKIALAPLVLFRTLSNPFRQIFRMLCTVHINFHSQMQALSPRLMKQPKPNISFICPKTGSTVILLFLHSFLPSFALSLYSIIAVGVKGILTTLSSSSLWHLYSLLTAKRT